MRSLKHKLLSGVFGASGGLAGLFSLSRCSGSTCSSCFGCVGAGMGILLMMLLNKLRRE